MYLNDGSGVFRDFTPTSGANMARWAWSSNFIDLNNDGNTDIIAVGKAALSEIGGVYGVFPYLGDGTGKWRPDDDTGLPSTGRMRTWGVNVADIDRDGVLDVGVAFGDVVSPGWRSGGSKTAGNTTPQRGKFGGVEVWRGQISDK